MSKVTPLKIINLITKTVGKRKLNLHEPCLGKSEINYLTKAIKSNFVSTSGKFVDNFENDIKKFVKVNHAIAMVNCSQALIISLKALGIKLGEEVLVPALTFVSTVNAIIHNGAEPHFIDSNIEDFGIDADKLDRYLKNNTIFNKNKLINKKNKRVISCIIPVHIFGHPCNLKKILKIAKKYNLKVIEDAAEALGSYYNGKHVGTFGDLGCISFNGNKIITTGSGGVILTNNNILAKKIRKLITNSKLNHQWEYIHDDVGYNLKMPSLNAALGQAQLKKINLFINAKRELQKKYTKNFKVFKNIKIFSEKKDCKSNYWLQTLILDNKIYNLKNKILNLSYKKKIRLRPAWKLISSLKPYKNKSKMNLSGAKEIYDKIINLPSSQSLILKKFDKF